MVNICQVRLLMLSLRFKHKWTGREGKLEQGLRGEKGLSHAHISSFIFNFQTYFRMIYTLTLTL